MSDRDRTPSERKAMRSVAVLKLCWNHVPRRDMVAVFTWRPRGDNQYFLPAPIKRYIDGA